MVPVKGRAPDSLNSLGVVKAQASHLKRLLKVVPETAPEARHRWTRSVQFNLFFL